ncbi:MAG: hypothetical protein AB7I30_05725, partial [Isosphaeraceae bacterium]
MGKLSPAVVSASMAVFVIGTTCVLGWLYYDSKKLYQAMALQGTALQAQTLDEMRRLYSSEVVDRVRTRGPEVTPDHRETPGDVPLP